MWRWGKGRGRWVGAGCLALFLGRGVVARVYCALLGAAFLLTPACRIKQTPGYPARMDFAPKVRNGGDPGGWELNSEGCR